MTVLCHVVRFFELQLTASKHCHNMKKVSVALSTSTFIYMPQTQLHSKMEVGFLQLAATSLNQPIMSSLVSLTTIPTYQHACHLAGFVICANNFQTSLSLEKTLGHWIHQSTHKHSSRSVSMSSKANTVHTTSAQCHTNTHISASKVTPQSVKSQSIVHVHPVCVSHQQPHTVQLMMQTFFYPGSRTNRPCIILLTHSSLLSIPWYRGYPNCPVMSTVILHRNSVNLLASTHNMKVLGSSSSKCLLYLPS